MNAKHLKTAASTALLLGTLLVAAAAVSHILKISPYDTATHSYASYSIILAGSAFIGVGTGLLIQSHAKKQNGKGATTTPLTPENPIYCDYCGSRIQRRTVLCHICGKPTKTLLKNNKWWIQNPTPNCIETTPS
jgi:hypothetical protein